MPASHDLTHTIQRVLAHYQRRVIQRSAVASLLSLGCLSLGVWRLSAAGAASVWGLALGAFGALALLGWQGAVIRRDWLSAAALTMKLDRALGLHARLLTAAEFADAADPPSLYPVLVEETQQALTDVSSRFPRATDRGTWLLAAALALLWLWPHRGSLLTRVAMRPPHVPPPIAPPPPPPPEAAQERPQQPQSSSSQGASGQQGTSGQSGSSQQQGGASGSSQTNPSSQQPSGNSSGSGQAQSKASHGDQPASTSSASSGGAPSSKSGNTDRTSDQPSASGRPEERPAAGASSQPHGGANDQQRKASSASSPQPRGGSPPASSSPRKPDGQRASEGTSQRSETRAGGDQSNGAKTAGSQPSSAGAGSSPGDAAAQEALRGDIQQLLKELSGELQTLQAQGIAPLTDQPHPLPGTTTDPKLYDDTPASLASKAGGEHLPIALSVDAQPTSRTRPGGGTGTPSGEVSDAAPQQLEEPAALAEPSADASASQRPAIPPEYQPVFERLSQRHDTSSKP